MALHDSLIRPLDAADDMVALTALIHRAYAPLGAAGMNFTAVDQTLEQTRFRVEHGHCLVAEQHGRVVGTLTLDQAYDPNVHGWARATPWFFRQDVMHLHQFAVDPALQAQGIGAALLAAAQQAAHERGARALALDTALPAAHLLAFYRRHGFAEVAQVQWDAKHYRSTVMLKALSAPPPALDDAEHRCAIVRCFFASFQARDWLAARALLRDDARMHWLASEEHFDDADAIIRVNAIYPEGWRIHVHSVEATLAGGVISVIEVFHGDQRFYASSQFTFTQGLIAFIQEIWATREDHLHGVRPASWEPTAAAPRIDLFYQ
ncbi:GNAT family N-acetyltransferase [Ideonella paludis]|uniref:GNAT family N-acetyltransferase n=1 Tax=Ideonella paludis TaxID=1233411 RepID=UPI00363D0DFB